LYRRYRGVEINWFHSNTKFLLDGYPRSGNTYFSGLSKKVFNPEIFIHHFHCIAAVKIALSRDLPSFILIRNPADAISSYYLKSFALKNKKLSKDTDKELVLKLTNDYYTFHKYILNNQTNLEIVTFESTINNPNKILDLLNERVFDNKYVVTHEQISEFNREYRGATDTLGSSRPNKTKERLKLGIKEALYDLDIYNDCHQIYLELSHKSK